MGEPSACTHDTDLPAMALGYAGVQVGLEYRARLGGMCYSKRNKRRKCKRYRGAPKGGGSRVDQLRCEREAGWESL